MKRLAITTMIFAAGALLLSCQKDINRELPGNECSILEIELGGQLGRAEITRTGVGTGTVGIYVMDDPDYNWRAVPVVALAISSKATASVAEGQTLNFNNPDRSAAITVRSQTGREVVWTVTIQRYDAFYVGTWEIIDVKIYCDQNLSGNGTGMWETSMGGSEFGMFGSGELDNIITITMNEGMTADGRFTGTITNDAGADGEYGDFWGVSSADGYPSDSPLDMNPRLRHLLPAGEAEWSLNLSTNEMSITKSNITSVMTFDNDGTTFFFNFALTPQRRDDKETNFYNNFWSSSYRFSYIVRKAD